MWNLTTILVGSISTVDETVALLISPDAIAIHALELILATAYEHVDVL